MCQIKASVLDLVRQAADALVRSGQLEGFDADLITVDRTRDPEHGDFATNLALRLSRAARCSPSELAAKLVERMPCSELVEKMEVAGPGFINFHLAKSAYLDLIEVIRRRGRRYGASAHEKGCSVMLEFVSSNPTGPLHVGHGRGAAYGDALSRVLSAAGHTVHKEYYINDAGRQMDILALSVWIRYLQAEGDDVTFPPGAYRGDYVRDVAARLRDEHSDRFSRKVGGLYDALPEDRENAMDELMHRCIGLLGDDDYKMLFSTACEAMVGDIRQDLEEFGVVFDEWFSERSLETGQDIDRSIRALETNGYLYEKQEAKWFRSTDFGDEKDRVVVRSNGVKTYFASDIAYHFNKAERGYDRIINIFGSDHHGYIKRIQASFEALGNDPDRLQFLLVQFASLYRGAQRVSMSTREGEFVTLRALRQEVGNDAARFFYVLRKPDQHMDFDLDLAKSRRSENPVYYVQYAHARICSVFRQGRENGFAPPGESTPDYRLLGAPQEIELLKTLSRFPEVVELAASSCEPHLVAQPVVHPQLGDGNPKVRAQPARRVDARGRYVEMERHPQAREGCPLGHRLEMIDRLGSLYLHHANQPPAPLRGVKHEVRILGGLTRAGGDEPLLSRIDPHVELSLVLCLQQANDPVVLKLLAHGPDENGAHRCTSGATANPRPTRAPAQ